MRELLLKNLSKNYGKTNAVTDMDLTVKDGEFIALLGPSGCGKTTTLRMIAGLEDATSGDIYFDGKRINDLPSKDRDMAMVFQDYALYPHMTVFDNIAFGLKMRGIKKDEIEKRVKKVSERLGIIDLLKRKPRSLSGGEKQRVALGRAMVRQPKIFLFDEPLSNLDAALRTQMRKMLQSLHKELKTTFIYVTHDQIEAMTMADKIAVMNNGVIQQYDTPDIIYRRPVNCFVAKFIGNPQMNMLDCLLVEEHNRVQCYTCGEKLLLPSNLGNDLIKNKATNKPLILGIRSEHFTIDINAGLSMTVSNYENTGADMYIYCSYDSKESSVVVRTKSPSDLPAIGSRIKLCPDWNEVRFFDLEKGTAIL